MRTPNCKHYDFAFETFEGEKKVYCAKKGGNVNKGDCTRCKDREEKDADFFAGTDSRI